jgi:threonine/homoserine/homoserine lactone efflux protein
MERNAVRVAHLRQNAVVILARALRMLKYLLIGSSFAFAAAAQPGPLQAFLLARVASGGWRRTLPAALAPLISDGPIALLVLLILRRLPSGIEQLLKLAGGVVLLYFAVTAFIEWRRTNDPAAQKPRSAPRTLLQAVAVNLVNPGPYLGWSLVLGPLALEAWQQAPSHAVGLVTAFYVTMVVSLALFILALGTTSFLGPRSRRSLLLLSAFALAAIAIYQLVTAMLQLAARS